MIGRDDPQVQSWLLCEQREGQSVPEGQTPGRLSLSLTLAQVRKCLFLPGPPTLTSPWEPLCGDLIGMVMGMAFLYQKNLFIFIEFISVTLVSKII